LKRLLSFAVTGALVASLTACAASGGLVSGSSVVLGEIASVASLNSDIATYGAAAQTSSDIENLTVGSFYSVSPSGELVANPDFGSVTVETTEPFTVKYALTGKAKWSDSKQINASDLLLSWAAATNLAKANFHSARHGNGLSQTVGAPKVSDDSLSISITFNRPVADYKTALSLAVPAHSLAQLAFKSAKLDAKAADERVRAAILDTNASDLKALAKSYHRAYAIDANFALEPELAVSSGAYVITEMSGDGITLKANPQNAAMPSARAETIKIAYFSSALAMIDALKISKLDLATFTPSAGESSEAITAALKDAETKKVVSELVTGSNIESLVFNLAKGSSFSPAAYGSSSSASAAKKALQIRQAFLNLVPISKLRSLAGATQSVQASRSLAFTQGSAFYDATIQDNNSATYLFADTQKAFNTMRQLDERVDVRVLFDADDPLAQIEYGVLANQAESVGFRLSNVSLSDPSAALAAGEYDVFLGENAVLSAENLDLEQTLADAVSVAQSSNLSDLLVECAKANDQVARASALKKIDAELIGTAYGLPFYQAPVVTAISKKFAKNPISAGNVSLTAGYATWNLAG
jgi:peptide/nickel transport system substrate-binding protein